MDSSSRADINASDYSLVPTSVLFERTPENILELACQDGYCIFSINKSLNSPLTFFFNSAQLGQAYFTCLFLSLLPLLVSGNRRLATGYCRRFSRLKILSKTIVSISQFFKITRRSTQVIAKYKTDAPCNDQCMSSWHLNGFLSHEMFSSLL